MPGKGTSLLARTASYANCTMAACACPLADAEVQYGRVTQDLFLYEFWMDVDERQSLTALRAAVAGLEQAGALLGRPDCTDRAEARNLARIVQSGLGRYRAQTARIGRLSVDTGPR